MPAGHTTGRHTLNSLLLRPWSDTIPHLSLGQKEGALGEFLVRTQAIASSTAFVLQNSLRLGLWKHPETHLQEFSLPYRALAEMF